MLTMAHDAKLAGVSKAPLGRAIKIGKISANKNAIAGWDVDPADLSRVHPVSASAVSGNSSMKRNEIVAKASTETAILVARLDAEIDWLKVQAEKVKEMHKQLALMKDRSEKWQEQVQTAQRLHKARFKPSDAFHSTISDQTCLTGT